MYSVFNPQNPQKCMKNARILHGGSITECLTPCKFLEKSIKPVKNCVKVKNRVRSVEKVRNRLRMAAEAWEILQGNPIGKFYRETLQGNPIGKSYREILQGNPIGKSYRETLQGNSIGKSYREILQLIQLKRLLKMRGHRGVGVVQWQRAGLSSTRQQVRISPWAGKKYGGTEKSWTIVVSHRGEVVGRIPCLIIDVPLGSFGQLDEVP